MHNKYFLFIKIKFLIYNLNIIYIYKSLIFILYIKSTCVYEISTIRKENWVLSYYNFRNPFNVFLNKNSYLIKYITFIYIYGCILLNKCNREKCIWDFELLSNKCINIPYAFNI